MIVSKNVWSGGDGMVVLIRQHVDPILATAKLSCHVEEFMVGVSLPEPLNTRPLVPKGLDLIVKPLVLLEQRQFELLEMMRSKILRAILDSCQASFDAVCLPEYVSKCVHIPLSKVLHCVPEFVREVVS